MKKLRVQSLPIKDVIEDISREFGIRVIKDCDVYSLILPDEYGTGTITGINFSSGIGIINYDCTFKTDVELDFIADSIHPAKFLYVKRGSVEHGLQSDAKTHILTQHQSSIVASADYNGHQLIFRKDEGVRLCSIEIDRAVFLHEMKCDVEKMSNPLKSLLKDHEAENNFFHEGGYSLKLFDMLRELDIKTYTGLVQRLTLLTTAGGVLREQIIQYEKDLNHTPSENKLLRNYVDLVKGAVESIGSNMHNPVNIEELAKYVGTNPTKLQQSFKMIYGTTVNGYMKNARLEKAAELLIYTDRKVSEIVNEVGLINRGYFSKLFRERYECSPKAYRMKFKKKYYERS